jgi:hypothetical protein
MGPNKSLLKPFSGRKGYASLIVKGELKEMKSRTVDEKVGESDYTRLHTSGGVHFCSFLTNPLFVPYFYAVI